MKNDELMQYGIPAEKLPAFRAAIGEEIRGAVMRKMANERIDLADIKATINFLVKQISDKAALVQLANMASNLYFERLTAGNLEPFTRDAMPAQADARKDPEDEN